MIISDCRSQFYSLLENESVLVISSLMVDSVCAVKILLLLLQSDNVKYMIHPVETCADLQDAILSNLDIHKRIILINCGGNINLTQLIGDSEVYIFVMDSHRPFNLENIYNRNNIRLFICEPNGLDSVPEYSSIFCTDENLRTNLWEAKRKQLMEEYYENSFYGYPASLCAFELCKMTSKDYLDILWFAIIGVTEFFMLHKIERSTYMSHVNYIQQNIIRLSSSCSSQSNQNHVSNMNVTFEEELNLYLFRHWSLIDSLANTPYTACCFKVWLLSGQRKLYEFLADMGLPISECKQRLESMNPDLRNSVKDLIKAHSPKFCLDDMFYPSFLSNYNYRSKLSASDMVLIIITLLDFKYSIDGTKGFVACLSMLDRNNMIQVDEHLVMVKTMLLTLSQEVRTFLDMHYIMCVGPFLFGVMPDGAINVHAFKRDNMLRLLAEYSLLAHTSMTKNKKARKLPFILSVPSDLNLGLSLIIGIPPADCSSTHNFLGAAFKQAALVCKCQLTPKFFDQTVIEIHSEDRGKFCNTLVDILS